MDTDLLDRRGRLVRIALSIAVGVLVTTLIYGWINSVTREANPDPMSQMGVAVVVIAIFVATTKLTLAILAAVRRRVT